MTTKTPTANTLSLRAWLKNSYKTQYHFEIDNMYVGLGRGTPSITVRVWTGRNPDTAMDAMECLNALADLGNALANLGLNVYMPRSNEGYAVLYVLKEKLSSEKSVQVFSKEEFVSLFSKHALDTNARIENARREKRESENAFARRLEMKRNRAMKLNPNLTWEIVAEDGKGSGLGIFRWLGDYGNVVSTFSFNKRPSIYGENGEYVYHMGFTIAQDDNGTFNVWASGSVNAPSIEEGLREFITNRISEEG